MKRVIGVFLFLLLAVGVVGAEGMTHDASEICVEVGGYNVNLQNALNNNWFNDLSGLPTSTSCYGMHDANGIFLTDSLNVILTLQDAAGAFRLNGESFLVPGEVFAGHSAEDVVFDDDETLQDKIEDDDMCIPTCGSKNCGSHEDGCGETINCGSCSGDDTCEAGVCTAPTCGIDYGQTCGWDGNVYTVGGVTTYVPSDSYLCASSPGYIDTCTGNCVGVVYKPAGTRVYASYWGSSITLGSGVSITCNPYNCYECTTSSRTCEGDSIKYVKSCITLTCTGSSRTPTQGSETRTEYVACGTDKTCDSDTTLCKDAGCPYIESLVDGEWNYNRVGISGLIQSNMKGPQMDKVYPEEENGEVSFRIYEISDETGYYDLASLVVVDHDEGEVYYDLEKDGDLLTLSDVKPVENCVDKYGRNCDSMIGNKDFEYLEGQAARKGNLILNEGGNDENAWFTPNANGLDLNNDDVYQDWLEFDLPDGWQDKDYVKLVVSGTETGIKTYAAVDWGSRTQVEIELYNWLVDNTVFGDVTKSGIGYLSGFHVGSVDEDGNVVKLGNEDFNDCVFDDYKTCVIKIDTSLVNNDGRIRIYEPAFTDVIDFIGVDYSEDAGYKVSEIELSEASYNGEDVSEKLAVMDDDEVEVLENEFIEMKFNGLPELSDGTKRSYFLKIGGYYQPYGKETDGFDFDLNQIARVAESVGSFISGDLAKTESKRYLENYFSSDICEVYSKDYCE